jgi:hypothetical protein
MKENKLNNLLDNDEIIDLRLSYSKISDFDRNGPISLIRQTFVDNEGVKHGSLVETLLLDKLLSTNDFDKNYVLLDIEKPTATLGSITDIILNNYTEIPTIEEVLNIVNKNAFWSRSKDDTKIANFNIPQFWDYLKIKFEGNSKIIVNKEQYDKAEKSANILLTHEFSKDLFYNNLENHYQVEFNYYYKGFLIKGFIDKMTIDRVNKRVYFEDIKTGEGKNDKFMESFMKYRYYFQALIYQKAFNILAEKYDFSDYTLMPFKFIYIGKTENYPLVYIMTDKWIKSALNGFTTTSGYKYKGLNENLDNIYYHWKNKQYEFNKEIYENKGIINLNDDFIKVNG